VANPRNLISIGDNNILSYKKAAENSLDLHCRFPLVDRLIEHLSSGRLGDGAGAISIGDELAAQVDIDRDLFVSLGAAPVGENRLARHSLQVAELAMAVGASMGLGRGDLVELGVGCLVHDAGMLRINRELVESSRTLGRIDFLEITKHPAFTFELLRDLKEFTTGSRMIAYQMHERWNGTGYPRRRRGKQIHYLARIAAVADVFIALISPRPHRPALLPSEAMQEVLRGTRDQLYDPAAVRGLLRTVSLFPIGSCVELSDGRIGTVIRANHDEYTRPVVEIAAAVHPGEPEAINLSQTPDLHIRRALPEIPTFALPQAADHLE
jgi:hypothetical protein